MMPMDWPSAAEAADRPVDNPRTHAGRERLSAIAADFFLDDTYRLNDEERSLMGAMLRGLVEEVADELLSRLPGLLAAQGEATRDSVYGDLRRSGLIHRQSIVDLLVRRTDEFRFGRQAAGRGEELLAKWVGGNDGGVAEAAMALTVARGRRKDRFGRLGIEFDDLAAEDAVVLVNAVAACIGNRLGADHDASLTDAARKILARHDEGRRLDAAVIAMARALDGAGMAADAMVDQIAQSGDSALVSTILSRRASIDPADGWDLFAGGKAMLLARMAGCRRQTAAAIVAAFDSTLGMGSATHSIDRFDRIEEAEAERCRRWLKLDPHYRAARDQLDQDHG